MYRHPSFLLTVAGLACVVLTAMPAAADPGGRGRGHAYGHYRGAFYVAPRPVYYAPRPYYYAPRPVYYAPAPRYYAPAPRYYAPQPIYAPAPMPLYYAPVVQPGIGIYFGF